MDQLSIARLDYEPIRIQMRCESDVERVFRVRAAQKEMWTTQFVESIQPGGLFYDVGANVGPYTLIAAARGIATVAIEPGAANYARLVENVFLNNFDERVTSFPVALGNGTGLTWFDYSDLSPGGASHVMGSPRKVYFHRQLVQVWKLDDLITTFHLIVPTHMKIDVDGNGDVEMAVLEGMAETLKNERLVGLMVEIPLRHEEAIKTKLAESGWAPAERFDERGGQKIGNICYYRFERVAVAAEPALAGAAA